MTFESKFATILTTQIISEFSFMNITALSLVALSVFSSVQFKTIDVKSMSEENSNYVVETVNVPETAQFKEIINNAKVEDVVKDYFKDIPILVKVAKCESHFRQVDGNGEVLRGIANSFDVGVMQINEKYHLERSQNMGVNIHSLAGNLEYARALYNDSGTAPWSASKPCWGAL